MKFLVFFLCALISVESLPLEEKLDFEGHDAAVEIHTNGNELETLVRNKRQYSPFPQSSFPQSSFPQSSFPQNSFPSQRLPAPAYSFTPPMNIQPAPNPFSGSAFGGGSTVGGRLNYDVPRGGGSVMGAHTFGNNPNTRVGVEGRLNLIHDKDQTLQLMGRHQTNLGPGPKMPENTVGLTYQRSFG